MSKQKVLVFFASTFFVYALLSGYWRRRCLRGFCILLKISCSPYDGQRTDTFLAKSIFKPCFFRQSAVVFSEKFPYRLYPPLPCTRSELIFISAHSQLVCGSLLFSGCADYNSWNNINKKSADEKPSTLFYLPENGCHVSVREFRS